MFRDNLQKIIGRKNLSESEMSETIEEIFSGKLSNAQIGAFMAALATKGETFEELAGAARVMRRRATRIQAPGLAVVDTCGTGGDGVVIGSAFERLIEANIGKPNLPELLATQVAALKRATLPPSS